MAIIVVANANDMGAGSLRDALANAADGDVIHFDPSLNNHSINLQSALLIERSVTIDGETSKITIDGGGTTSDIGIQGASSQVAISNLIIADGHGAGQMGVTGFAGQSIAGGITLYQGSLALTNDTFTDDSAVGGKGGPSGTGAGGQHKAAGNGGDAAGAVYVYTGATVVSASQLKFDNDTATAGAAGGSGASPGTAYPISNNQTVLDAAVCFASGTLIRTAYGDVAVEDLMVGDFVVTASGGERPVFWTSHRTIDRPGLEATPVRIRAGAFATDLPERDLYLSPGHPVLVGADADGAGGHLVPIMCLINGTTIERVRVPSVTYWHVELDSHDIVLAEGLPAESYIDIGSRDWFAGADTAFHDPDLALPGMTGRCRPVAIDGPVVEAERRRLDAVLAVRLASAAAWPDIQNTLLAMF